MATKQLADGLWLCDDDTQCVMELDRLGARKFFFDSVKKNSAEGKNTSMLLEDSNSGSVYAFVRYEGEGDSGFAFVKISASFIASNRNLVVSSLLAMGVEFKGPLTFGMVTPKAPSRN